jgi:hypothetical protein
MTPQPLLTKSSFQLDASGVAGFFGGDEAIYAMATVHVYEGRKWLGWYNSPGSYTVAKKYGQLAHSGIWDGLFPGVSVDPAELFEMEGNSGPEYWAVHSGTVLKSTGQTGFLFMKECEALEEKKVVQRRKTRPEMVTIAELMTIPNTSLRPTLSRPNTYLLAAIPMISSLCACVVCGVYRDWYCFSMILLGIVVNGLACLVIGSADLTFTHPEPARGSPKGDGMMKGDREIVILLGEEGAVNSVTRGEFSLQFADKPDHKNVGRCSLLLIVQFLAQLLLIPQGTLFGQIMFLSTLAVSWGYNSYLSSADRVKIQRRILVEKVLGKIKMTKYKLGTRTTMAVFVLLVLRPPHPEKILNGLLPNDTKTWRIWKKAVLDKLEGKVELYFDESDYDGVDEQERSLLENLYDDAEAAYDGFREHHPGLSDDVDKAV